MIEISIGYLKFPPLKTPPRDVICMRIQITTFHKQQCTCSKFWTTFDIKMEQNCMATLKMNV